LGLYSTSSTQILASILPSVAIGIPLGAYLIRHMPVETFRRICMSFDAWIVGFGLSRVLIVLQLLRGPVAYSVWLSVIMIDAYLLYLFFGGRQSTVLRSAESYYRRRQE